LILGQDKVISSGIRYKSGLAMKLGTSGKALFITLVACKMS